jgi:SAM-dependent methyltransferase
MNPVEEGLALRIPTLVDLWREGPVPRRASGARPAIPGRREAARLSAAELEGAGAALLRLQRGLTGERSLVSSAYMDEAELLGAYLLYYWPVSYLQVGFALQRLRPDLRRARRVLDLGSGPGPASAAFIDAGAQDLVLADSSPRALALARRVLSASSGPSLSDQVLDFEDASTLPEGPFDAIVASHLLNELWKGSDDRIERRCRFLMEASTRLSPEGYLLLVEPSLLSTSRDLLELRDALIRAGFTLLGPCRRQGGCPALAAGDKQTCHDERAWSPPEPPASLARAAGLDRDSVKMTWLALSPPGAPSRAENAGAADPGTAIPDALVVSEGLLNKAGRVRYMLCDARGRYAFSARRDDEAARAQGFFKLRRYDRIEVVGAEGRNPDAEGVATAFGFAPGSRIRVLGPA